MPRETLTRERIVAAAVERLDREGLEGLNMRALGAQLGSAATATYWHVGSKANLIVLAADHVWSEIVLPDPSEIGWRAAASRMATELHAMLTRHPWLLQAFGSHVLYGPGKARYDDHSLAIYEDAGFMGEQADRAATTVFTFVLGNALGPASAAALSRTLEREGESAQETVRERMAAAREIAAQFPRLRSRLDTAAAADYSAGPEQAFEFGLQAILDGLERQLGAAPPSADGGGLQSEGRDRRARAPAPAKS
jgi:AcrR family transcriptional regulator